MAGASTSGQPSDAPNQAPNRAMRKGYTPPKGRPTRARTGRIGRQRVFGPVAQWIAVVVFLLLVFAVLIAVTGGGDFNPFDDGTGAPAPTAVGSSTAG
jgi:hypothetical protein